MNETSAPEPFDPATAWLEPPGMAKALTIGVAVGVAASFFGVGGAFLAAGQPWTTAIGMGVFVAMWGGLGFGGMLGGVIWASRVEGATEHERLEARQEALGAADLPEQASPPACNPIVGSTSSPAMAEVAG